MMKPNYLTRTLVGVVAVFTLLAALISPVPAYASTSGGHEPPPPKPPSNDLGLGGKAGSPDKPGDKGRGSTSTPAGTVSPSTPLLMAAQLSIGGLIPSTAVDLPLQVKFCTKANPDFTQGVCTQETTIEDMITYIKGLDDASGVIYVAQNYSTGLTLPQPGLVFDQSTFTGAGSSLVTDLTMHGGIIYSDGTQTAIRTILTQPVTIQNFNDLSKFSMDTFQINVSDYAPGDPAEAALNVISSNHITLDSVGIHETGKHNGLLVTQSNDLTLQDFSVSDNNDGMGVVIDGSSKISFNRVFSTSTSRDGYGAFLTNNRDTLTMTDCGFNGSTNDGLFVLNHDGDISLNGLNASGNLVLGAAFLFNSGALSIQGAMFDNNGNQGIQISGQDGPVSLDTVSADGNVFIGASLTSISSPISLLNSHFNQNGLAGLSLSGDSGQVDLEGVTATQNHSIGASIAGQSNGDVTILNSFFDNNGNGGLSVSVSGGSITLNNVSTASNLKTNGATLNSFVPAGSLEPSIQVTGGNFSGNGAQGMQVTSNGEIDISYASFLSNTTNGLAVNGLNKHSAINLSWLQADSNGQIGAALSFTGNTNIADSTFTGNRIGGLDLEEIFNPPVPGDMTPYAVTVTLNQVQASGNGIYGALLDARFVPLVNVVVTDSNFDQNKGKARAGLIMDTFGSVKMNHVSASGNAGDGVDITSWFLFIDNSIFNSNAGYGLVLDSSEFARLANVKACFNGLGPDDLLGVTPVFSVFDTSCSAPATESKHAPLPAEEAGMPWQTITVFSDPGGGQGTGRLSCQMGTTFIYMQKGTPPAADQELARVELPPCLVPDGSTASFQGLAQGGLPAPLPDGATFQGPAFNLSISGPGGGPASPGGALTLHFSLPAGFNLPAGKRLAVLWFDPAANQWVELPTFDGPNSAFAFPVKAGVFVLVAK